MEYVIDYLLHFDQHLTELAALYGGWLYGLLFLIVFAETGLIVTPFLPGDSLLFAAGALAGGGALDLGTLVLLLSAAAIIGDGVNYSIGRAVGPRVFRVPVAPGLLGRLLNRDHLQQAHTFFDRHGGKAIVLARFAPIARTFVPFVAGAASMGYGSFLFYNVLGGVLWVLACAGAGYAFGHVPLVKEHFPAVALGIVGLSFLPVALELARRSRPLQRRHLAGSEARSQDPGGVRRDRRSDGHLRIRRRRGAVPPRDQDGAAYSIAPRRISCRGATHKAPARSGRARPSCSRRRGYACRSRSEEPPQL